MFCIFLKKKYCWKNVFFRFFSFYSFEVKIFLLRVVSRNFSWEVIKIINRITSIFLGFHWLLSFLPDKTLFQSFCVKSLRFQISFLRSLLCGRIYCCEKLRSLLNKLSAQRMGKFAWACKWIKMGFPLSICSWKKNRNYAISIFLELLSLRRWSQRGKS